MSFWAYSSCEAAHLRRTHGNLKPLGPTSGRSENGNTANGAMGLGGAKNFHRIEALTAELRSRWSRQELALRRGDWDGCHRWRGRKTVLRGQDKRCKRSMTTFLSSPIPHGAARRHSSGGCWHSGERWGFRTWRRARGVLHDAEPDALTAFGNPPASNISRDVGLVPAYSCVSASGRLCFDGPRGHEQTPRGVEGGWKKRHWIAVQA